MSSVLKYSELDGRCLAILRLGGTKVDEELSNEVVASSTESVDGPPLTYPPPTNPPLTYPPTTEESITYPPLPPLPTETTPGMD